MYNIEPIRRPAFLDRTDLRGQYEGRRVLVLGGDGFLGGHVAAALQVLGAKVSVLSRRSPSLLEGTGVTIHRGDLRGELRPVLLDKEIVFDLAGSTGGVGSNRDARRNLVAECAPHLNAFQTAAEMLNPPLVVFCSTRTVYGKPQTMPVCEGHRLAPESMYAIHKIALEQYLRAFQITHGLGYVVFRLSNPFGPYPWREKKDYGVINQFLASVYSKQPIRLFGDGSQLRDYIFIDDVVETFLRAAIEPACHQQVFNLGGPAPLSIREAVDVMLRQRPGSEVQCEPWPTDYRAIETGDYITDLGRIRGCLPGVVHTPFEEGVRITFETYDRRPAPVIPAASIPARPKTVRRPPDSPGRESDWDGKRVLVTGASGFIGGALVSKLVSMGCLVGAVHRQPLPPAMATASQVVSLHMDLEDVQRVRQEIDAFEPSIIFHMASRPDGEEVENHAASCINANLLGTTYLLEAAKRCGVSAFVFADSTKVYGNSQVPHREERPADPTSSYAVSKLGAWNYCKLFSRLHGLNTIALRPTLVFGPGQGRNLFTYLAACLVEGCPEIVLDGGSQTRDPLYIDDALRAYLLAAERAAALSGRAIPIGGGTERTVEEIARLFVQCAGYDTPVRSCSERTRPTEILRSYCDNVDAWEALHWRPERSLKEAFCELLSQGCQGLVHR